VIVSTTRPIPPGDVRRLDGIRCSSAERTILDGPRFGFTRIETEQAIDSALRLGLVAEGRLRERVLAEPWSGVAGSRVLLNALVDAGGHSALERAFLRLVRRNGLPRPRLQVVHRSGGQHVARVDALFPPDLVVEVAGHGTHATRRQRQIDAQRQTELTLLGRRLLTFTYEDVADRPQWVARRIAEALAAPPGTCP
jgi:very-short-patch-repair endonuclease